MKYSSTIGSKVSIRTEKEMVTGTAIGIGKHGELIVKTKKGKKSIITGDITYLE
jgi:biotin-(acetyl-CoA carboxylase) ligase